MDMPSRLELRHLRYFCVVADELHFGRAATRLALSQPALSVQIKQLEEMIGASLLSRHSRHVALTDAGRALEESARRILRDVDLAVDQTRQASVGQIGVLRVGFSATLMLSTLAHVIRAYRARFPGVRVDLRELATAEQFEGLLRGDLDVAFMRGAENDPRVHVELFAREPLVIAVNRDHPLASATKARLSALAHDPWVLFPRAIAPQLHDQVIGLCRRAGFVPHVVQESREVYTTVGETVRRMSWKDVAYKPIPRAFVRLAMVRPSGPVRPVVDAFLAVARSRRS
jgi:DNA-binding transcriptional LysR family regulator